MLLVVLLFVLCVVFVGLLVFAVFLVCRCCVVLLLLVSRTRNLSPSHPVGSAQGAHTTSDEKTCCK